jgi:hypothetical protein
MAGSAPAPNNNNGMMQAVMAALNAIGAQTRSLSGLAKALSDGLASRTLADVDFLSPDTVGRGAFVNLMVALAASNSGTDVDFRTNPEYDIAIYGIRAYIEVLIGDSTVSGAGPIPQAACHTSVRVWDPDRTLNLTDGTATTAAAGGAGAFCDLALLGANNGRWSDFPVPYVIKGVKGTSIMRSTFATDSTTGLTRRMGISYRCVYRRRSFRQAEVV